jgi:hypothetical protein
MRPAAPPSKKTLQPDDEPTPPLTRGAPLTAPSPIASGAPRTAALANLGTSQRNGARSVSNPPPPAYLSDEDDVDELARMKAAHDNPFSSVNSANRQTFGGMPNQNPSQIAAGNFRGTMPTPTAGPQRAPFTTSNAPPQPAQSPADAARQAALDRAKAAAAQKARDANNGVSNLNPADQAAYSAEAEQLAASKAQALQTAAARSGAAGFGLSGASAALQGDIGAAQDRNAVQTLAQLRGSLSEQEFNDLQREVALNDAEETDNVDYNHDGYIGGKKVAGKIGDHNPADYPADNPADQNTENKNKLKAARANMTGDGGDFNPFTGDVADGKALLSTGQVTFNKKDARIENDGSQWFLVVRGSDGKLYKFDVPAGDVPNKGFGLSNPYDVGAQVLVKEGLAT